MPEQEKSAGEPRPSLFKRILRWFKPHYRPAAPPLDSHDWANKQEVYRQILSNGSNNNSEPK